MRRKKLTRIQKKMILDFSGSVNLKDQPSKTEDLDNLIELLIATDKDSYEKAKSVIVDRQIPNSTSNDVIASKVVEIASSNLQFQESHSINEITKSFMNQVNSHGEQVLEIARNEIKEASKKFTTVQVKVGKSKARKIKGLVCKEFERLLSLAQERVNILMVGPSGSGKTHISAQIAEALGLDYASQSCSSGMSESALIGWLLPIGTTGAFKHVESEFIRIYENGGVFLFDEMDAADPNTLIFMNQALANGRFFLPQRFKKPEVKMHKDFVAVAAANTFGGGADAMYHARNALDAATLDRFRMGTVVIDYDQDVETKLVDESVYKWAIKIRRAINKHGMKKLMTTRFMKDATQMRDNQDWTMNQIADSYFADWTKEEIAVVKQDYEYADKPDDKNNLDKSSFTDELTDDDLDNLSVEEAARLREQVGRQVRVKVRPRSNGKQTWI